ncbi:hypothetical protein A9B99_02865 [Mangrovibacter phragmitis]|jgi:methylated-DNA-[protein]-cysteine S-methyltransferase|uniref:Methylated-DNA--protein-cysteine methyltransferase n=1 Tax=Mangrovibacter phragmitis TaxID=1691903 RepID=A0A1B7L8R2_9ENTR|nr:methylated-DNA--[protein]-cysteine S-methyltransferase [Mangrovibacter phragmitis]OAT78676.1 hypothetical protein A9B99_02865 [Mangrovibacter phragmitis]
MPDYCLMPDTPAGPLLLQASSQALESVRFLRTFPLSEEESITQATHHPVLHQACEELAAYFAGQLTHFTTPLAPGGTVFQRKVWEALRQIPWGETRTYGEIAHQIGNPAASRAVGLANNRNRLPFFIPCHRVIGASGKLVGYAGGLDVKQALLSLEGIRIAL